MGTAFGHPLHEHEPPHCRTMIHGSSGNWIIVFSIVLPAYWWTEKGGWETEGHRSSFGEQGMWISLCFQLSWCNALVDKVLLICYQQQTLQNLELKKVNDEKKAALAAQFAAEATLRRVHAAQKDDEMPPIEAIITPLEAELKLARLEVYKNM